MCSRKRSRTLCFFWFVYLKEISRISGAIEEYALKLTDGEGLAAIVWVIGTLQGASSSSFFAPNSTALLARPQVSICLSLSLALSIFVERKECRAFDGSRCLSSKRSIFGREAHALWRGVE